MELSGASERDLVSALANGLRAMEAFSPADRRMSLSEVAHRTGLTRAAARRYLHTLTAAGYAEFDGKRFQLTPRVLRFAHAYLSSISLPQVATPIVEELSRETDEGVSLSVLDGSESLVVVASVPRRIVGAYTRVGTHLPVLVAASGRVLLAGKSDEFVEQMLSQAIPKCKLTPKTKVAPAEIRAEVARIRATGHALNDEEIEVGLRVVAVPVRNTIGNTVAALSVSTYSGRYEIGELEHKFLPALAKASARLGQLI
jgi:IclR family transcriptional regulator, pca regulon regulatory protein